MGTSREVGGHQGLTPPTTDSARVGIDQRWGVFDNIKGGWLGSPQTAQSALESTDTGAVVTKRGLGSAEVGLSSTGPSCARPILDRWWRIVCGLGNLLVDCNRHTGGYLRGHNEGITK